MYFGIIACCEELNHSGCEILVMAQPLVSQRPAENVGNTNGFQPDFTRAFSAKPSNGDGGNDTNPFLMSDNTQQPPQPQPSVAAMWQQGFGAAPTTDSGFTSNAESQGGSMTSGNEQAGAQIGNPFGVVKQEPVSQFQGVGSPFQQDLQRFTSQNSSSTESPISFPQQQQQQQQPPAPQPPVTTAAAPPPIPPAPKGIYENTPFCE
ncbi:unnamed protein product [Cylicostephanus goldi]|uniref:Uncharacterized protein n=1 Tax=Cylicostephanus goldi TaxID=71465 RepID=A0A3P6SP67_CYLGO|nr:unnamed protein product [Cylicostephanus goldi]